MSTLDNTFEPKTNAPIWKTALLWAGYATVAGILVSLIMFLFDYNPMAGGMSGMFIMLVIGLIMAGIFAGLAIKQYRDKDNGGYVKYGPGLLISVVVSAISGMGGQLWEYIMGTVIDPLRYSKMAESFAETWGDAMPPEALEEALKKFEEGPQLMSIFTNGLFGGAFFGLIVGLVVAAIMKREPKAM
jgi:predicted benzoate:H+ symporter BenE